MQKKCPMDCLETQLCEMDMLMSMFSTENELILDDPSVVVDIRSLVESGSDKSDNKINRTPIGQIGFTLKLMTENKHSLEMIFRLPQTYPKSPPDVSVRNSHLSRFHHQRFNQVLRNFIEDLKSEEPVVYEISQWIKDNIDTYIEQSIKDNMDNNTKDSSTSSNSPRNNDFTRLWIYSHHIYNKVKRKTILDLASDLNLTGFSVPGKPGIICVEGEDQNAADFWQRIRSMQWKKISLIHHETVHIGSGSETLEHLRAFTGFEEKHFDPRPGRGREVHMDHGLLFQFLQQHGFADMFQMYFGISGREAHDDSD